MRAAATGATHVSVVEVQLTVLDETPIEAHMDSDEFLRSLVVDPERMSAWFAGAATADPAAFEEGLMELLRVSGPSGFMQLLESLAAAFVAQRPEAKDVLLGLSLDDGPTRDLTAGMFSLLSPGDIATSVLEGGFGRNMLSLSTALTRLPLERVTEEVRAEVQALLPTAGHSEDEAQFLSHMIEVREAAEPEPTLIEADGIYRAVVEAATVTDEAVDEARESVLDSQRSATPRPCAPCSRSSTRTRTSTCTARAWTASPRWSPGSSRTRRSTSRAPCCSSSLGARRSTSGRGRTSRAVSPRRSKRPAGPAPWAPWFARSSTIRS